MKIIRNYKGDTMHLLEGKISVKAAIASKYRIVKEIIIDIKKKDRDTSYILYKAKENNIVITRKKREEIDAMCDGNTHGGIVAYVEERSFSNLEEVIQPNGFLAFIEGVEDPFNFGYIVRSLYAAGCDAILLSPRNWTSAATILARSSAGASELMKMVVCEDMEQTLQTLKANNYKIVCANRNDKAIEMYDYNFNQSVCICIGGEKRGLSKIVENNSDQDVYIPYNNDFKNALSAASASTILAFEILRQRKQK